MMCDGVRGRIPLFSDVHRTAIDSDIYSGPNAGENAERLYTGYER